MILGFGDIISRNLTLLHHGIFGHNPSFVDARSWSCLISFHQREKKVSHLNIVLGLNFILRNILQQISIGIKYKQNLKHF